MSHAQRACDIIAESQRASAEDLARAFALAIQGLVEVTSAMEPERSTTEVLIGVADRLGMDITDARAAA